MTAFRSEDGARPGGDATTGRGARPSSLGQGDEPREGHISFKDNRRIDPETGQVRATAERGDRAGASASGPAASGTGAGNAGGPSPFDAAELDAARTEAAERTADLQRLSAEYANYRKRVERDKQAATAAGKASVVAELLTVLDDLDRAEDHGDLTGGFKNVADKLTGTLQRLGLEHYGAEGDPFDPNVHEAVQFATASDVTEPTVSTVLRLGYRFDERVLRPAVVVVTGPADESDDTGGDEAGDDGDAEASGDGAPASGVGDDHADSERAGDRAEPDASGDDTDRERNDSEAAGEHR